MELANLVIFLPIKIRDKFCESLALIACPDPSGARFILQSFNILLHTNLCTFNNVFPIFVIKFLTKIKPIYLYFTGNYLHFLANPK